MLLDYIRGLFSVFFRWWWAAITGVFTIMGPWFMPSEGVNIGATGMATLIFVFLALLFLVISAIAASWKWYAIAEFHPQLVEIVPAQTSTRTPLTFVVRPSLTPLSPGSLLAVFRLMEHGVEVCAAVLEVKLKRTNGVDWQAEPRWIRAIHKTALQTSRVKKSDLRIRLVNGEALGLVEKCTMEKA